MGQYVQVGICTKLAFYAPDLEPCQTSATITNRRSVSSTIDLSLFDRGQSGEELAWTLRSGMLEAGLVEFLQSQWDLAEGRRPGSSRRCWHS